MTTTTATSTTWSSSSTSSTLLAPVCGVANEDDDVTAADALATLRVAVGQPSSSDMLRCDTDHSGVLQSSDSLRILRAAVGQPVILDCPA